MSSEGLVPGLLAPPSLRPLDFQLLFASAPGLYLVLTPDLTIVAASDAYLRATMTSLSAIVGRGLFEVFPDSPDDPDATGVRNLQASLTRVLATRASDAMAVQKYPIRLPESEGGGFTERYWSPTNSPALSPSGEVAFIIHRVEDVTEFIRLKQEHADQDHLSSALRTRSEQMEIEIFLRAQEIQETNRQLRDANEALGKLQHLLERKVEDREHALRSSDERFRMMVEGVKDYALFMLDRAGNIISWNPGAERITGYLEDEIVGRNYACFFGPEDRAAEVPNRQLRDAARLESIEEQGWRVRKNGSRFWASGVLTALYDEQQQLRGYARVSRDLTEQRRAEVLLQSIVDTASDGIITIDRHGTIQTFNKAAEMMFGHDAKTAIGGSVSVLMPAASRADLGGHLATLLQRGGSTTIGIGQAVTGCRRDGSTFPLELAISQFSQDGETCFTGLVRDVTAQRELEGHFQQAQKMEAIGQLAGGIAHDFNNLLTVISGYSDLVLTTLSPDNACHPMVREIYRAGERAAGLTRQLLAFSRRTVREPRVLDLNAILINTESLLQRLIGEDVQLTTNLAPDLYQVSADAGQIDQVLINLAVNARDAMPEGGALCIGTRNLTLAADHASTHASLAPGDHVLISISDTGCGMSPEVRARIFEPFFTTKGVGKGTGLGLSVVEGIIKQSGGSIEVTSQVDVGTTFTIFLPGLRESQPLSAHDGTQQPIRGTETILLVEDEPAVRGLAARVLRQCGYRVLAATSGQQALVLAERYKGRIDLLSTDVVMPGMSGRILAGTMQARHPGIKVMYMSGYTDDAVVRHGIQQADIAFLQKPFTPNALARKIRDVLDGP